MTQRKSIEISQSSKEQKPTMNDLISLIVEVDNGLKRDTMNQTKSRSTVQQDAQEDQENKEKGTFLTGVGLEDPKEPK